MRPGQTRATLIRVGNHYAEVERVVAPQARPAAAFCPVCGKPTSKLGNACYSHGQERRWRRVRFTAYRDEAQTDEERAFWTQALERNG